ncbi:hypothetical protein [Prosthecobacter sp.]|uniref:hypothetical protein n=1 Tax=Prosthecobacter sp. TaxID=1965333 RepID=UPI00378389BB
MVIDGTHLQGVALRMRSAISEGIIPMLLDLCKREAERGQMEMLFIPKKLAYESTVQINPLTLCESLQPELQRRGLKTEISRQSIPRIGMIEEQLVMAISWRDIAP